MGTIIIPNCQNYKREVEINDNKLIYVINVNVI